MGQSNVFGNILSGEKAFIDYKKEFLNGGKIRVFQRG